MNPWDQMLEEFAAKTLGNSSGAGVVPAGGGATSAGKPDPVIWLGTSDWSPAAVGVPTTARVRSNLTPYADGTPRMGGFTEQQRGVSLETRHEMAASEAELQMYRWQGEAEFDRWGDLLVSLGIIDEADSRSLDSLDKYWRLAVDSAATFALVGKRVTPWQAIRMIAGDEEAIRKRTGGGDGGSGGPRTVRQQVFNLTSPQDARGLITNVLTQHLGRRPTEEEYEAFTATLNAAERANPTTTIVTYDEDGNSTHTTTGGLSASGATTLLEGEARALPDYAETQAAMYYANALFASLDSPV